MSRIVKFWDENIFFKEKLWLNFENHFYLANIALILRFQNSKIFLKLYFLMLDIFGLKFHLS